VLTNNEVQGLIEVGHETTNVEFKRGDSLDDRSYVATVARAAMSLANTRDGGHILLGVDNINPAGDTSGMEPSHVEAWLNHDNVMAKVNAYADPPMALHSESRSLPNGQVIVVLEVSEFDSVPILCKRDQSDKLRSGELYTRSLSKPESSRTHTQNELRAVLDLATSKQLRRFVETAQGAQLDIGLPGEADPFIKQLEALGTRFGLEQRPLLTASIRPNTFEKDRLPFEALPAVVRQMSVHHNGWSEPESLNLSNRGDDWIADLSEWFLYQSGLLFFVDDLPSGYEADRDSLSGAPDSAAGYVPVWWLTTKIALFLEVACRYQQSQFRDLNLLVQVTLRGAEGWQLVVANPGRSSLWGAYRIGGDTWIRDVVITPEVALNAGRELAAGLTHDLFQRFGWERATLETIKDMQNQAFGPSRP
jgi:hypothetical protein